MLLVVQTIGSDGYARYLSRKNEKNSKSHPLTRQFHEARFFTMWVTANHNLAKHQKHFQGTSQWRVMRLVPKEENERGLITIPDAEEFVLFSRIGGRLMFLTERGSVATRELCKRFPSLGTARLALETEGAIRSEKYLDQSWCPIAYDEVPFLAPNLNVAHPQGQLT